ncbi:MAG: GNAT family N-acetyltransferase [Spirochaetales bacterium]|nr:GNAT family N-acetyltransferase [Spirochaetales bacterium]
MKQFVKLPQAIYQNSPNWVPPLWHDEHKAYSPKHNVMLQHNDYQLFLARSSQGIPVGRILVYIDTSYNRHTDSQIGFFGAFECEDKQKSASLLLGTAYQWLKERRMLHMRGPIHPIAESWGFLLHGYDSAPVLMAPYNPPYYLSQMEHFGLRKVKDLFAYEADTSQGYVIPERISRFTSSFLQKHPEFTLRTISIKHLMQDAEHIWRITNTALKDNWGYVPVDRSIMEDMVRRLKPLLDAKAIWFVEEKGTPVGFALGFPDPNPLIQSINGKLMPTGFLRFVLGKQHLKRYRLISLGVLPRYQGLGLDVLLYKHLHEALSPRGIILEANYILEDNWNIRNALEKLNLKRTKEYRIYQMQIN